MSQPYKIPMAVIVRAAQALQAAEQTPATAHMSGTTWSLVMRAGVELRIHLNRLLADQQVELTE